MVVFEHVAREFNGVGRERVAALTDFNLEARAAELLRPFSRAAVDRTVSETVLPRLLTRLGAQ